MSEENLYFAILSKETHRLSDVKIYKKSAIEKQEKSLEELVKSVNESSTTNYHAQIHDEWFKDYIEIAQKWINTTDLKDVLDKLENVEYELSSIQYNIRDFISESKT